MPSPTPYVVTQLFDRVAMLPSGGSGMSLFDVRDMVPALISSLGYAPEQESNIRAALMTRLNLLLAPTRAHDIAPVAELLDPTRPHVGDGVGSRAEGRVQWSPHGDKFINASGV